MITAIAGQHGRTAAQTVLRSHIELGLSVVAKSADPARIAANIDIFNFAADQRTAIKALDRGEDNAADSDQVGDQPRARAAADTRPSRRRTHARPDTTARLPLNLR